MSSTTFRVDRAKTGRAKCKGCKEPIVKAALRIGKVTASPFSDDGEMTLFYHPKCIFEAQMRGRAATTKIEEPGDIEGYQGLDPADRSAIKVQIDAFVVQWEAKQAAKATGTRGKGKGKTAPDAAKPKAVAGGAAQRTLRLDGSLQAATKHGAAPSPATHASTGSGVDHSFLTFQNLCNRVAAVSSHTEKTRLIRDLITNGTSGDGFTGDVYLVMRLMLPVNPKRVYNMKDKQLVKAFSEIFGCDPNDMHHHLENGDCPDTLATFFRKSTRITPRSTSTLTLAEVEEFLCQMEALTKLDDQHAALRAICKRCTANDLLYIGRLLKHDLRTFVGPKNVLGALNPHAYEAWQASNDLRDVVARCQQRGLSLTRQLSVRASIMTPIKPMLANACKVLADAFKKCQGDVLAEIKYDGERVQVHKKGGEFQFFSRSLKPVTEHKIKHFREVIKSACPHGNSMVLDAEVLMVDKKTSLPLPFGTLGIHKKAAYADAQPCLFIFDIMHFNGQDLMAHPLRERRKLLLENVVQVQNEIMHSEQHTIKQHQDLHALMSRVLREGLEGLVLKDAVGTYEPGKRHWLKVKKDYLNAGAIADTADLVVLGAYFGTGSKGGLMSTFLMGCQDGNGRWRTVCKVGNGHDDATIDEINDNLQVHKIHKRAELVPAWLDIRKPDLVPDFVVKDPKAAPVWEITAAEFSESTSHSADGLSMRFPRVTKIRDDKDWTSHTDLQRLKLLAETSKGGTDLLPTSTPSVATAKPVAVVPKTEPKPKPKPKPKEKGKAGRPKRKALASRSSDEGDTGADLRDFIVPDDEPEDGVMDERSDGSDSEFWPSDEEAGQATAAQHRSKRTKRLATKRTPCKYGAACYQKNPRHKRDFCHPSDPDWTSQAQVQDQPAVPPQPQPQPQPQTSSGVLDADARATDADARATDADARATLPADDAAPAALTARTLPQLADVFAGKVFHVTMTTPPRDLTRYIIAYGGTIEPVPGATVNVIVAEPGADPSEQALLQRAANEARADALIVEPKWVWERIRAGTAPNASVPQQG